MSENENPVPEYLKRERFVQISDRTYSDLLRVWRGVCARKEAGKLDKDPCFVADMVLEVLQEAGDLTDVDAEVRERLHVISTGWNLEDWRRERLKGLKKQFPDLEWSVLDHIGYLDLQKFLEELEEGSELEASIKDSLHFLKLFHDPDREDELLALCFGSRYPSSADMGFVGLGRGKSPNGLRSGVGCLSVLDSRRDTIERTQRNLDIWAFRELYGMNRGPQFKKSFWDLLGQWFYYPLLLGARLYQKRHGLRVPSVDSPEARETRKILREAEERRLSRDKSRHTVWDP